MRKSLLILFTLFCLVQSASAAHIKGGFFTYRYLGPGNGTNLRYQITLTVYMAGTGSGPTPCIPNPGQLSNPINFSIFDAGTNQLILNPSVSITNQYILSKMYDEPCISGDQRKCYYYVVVYDLASVELPAMPEGLIVSYQRCCRINGINNVSGSSNVGNTFWIKIPGINQYPGAETNSSPSLLVNDTVVVCVDSYFEYSFKSSDSDGDSLSYSFCQAYLGGDGGGNSAPNPASNPPYSSIPYAFPYSGTQPMGPGVNINPVTGLISGNAPNALGTFVLCVCINEYRNGVLIGVTRKELHVDVEDCNPLQAVLNPKPTTCDGFTVSFQNDAGGNPPGTEYQWTFGEPSSGLADTSILANPNHTYALAGDYTVNLIVALSGGLCADTASFVVKVYPGFRPGFTEAGSCFTNPFQFTDTTTTDYGVVDTWSWNFGDMTTLADTSHLQDPQWTYAGPGPVNVRFIVTNSKGCIDTVDKQVIILDKPPLSLAFRDTLICRNDEIQLDATGSGAFSWTPLINIIGANTATPSVSPLTTTWYYVRLNDNGCINDDSVRVRVVPNVSLAVNADTTICQGDTIQLRAISDGLTYAWTSTPGATILDPASQNPYVITTSNSTYFVTATIGGCSADEQVQVITVPYPVSNAGPDPTICYNTSAQLNAAITGAAFTWTPVNYLDDPLVLNPVSTPPRTTEYILTVTDTLGCPKPVRDTVTVIVNPKVIAFAGNDTTVVIGQPLQFNATGGVNYLWSPATGLSSTTINNPIGTYGPDIDSVTYKVIVTDAAGCPDSTYVTVRVFKTNPYVFVPTAFTPNNDGLNDFIAPIAVGMQRINFFSVYNRWGQPVFSTTVNGKGWDGRINGRLQDSGVFVWMVSGVDYLGKEFFLKGTVTLIR